MREGDKKRVRKRARLPSVIAIRIVYFVSLLHLAIVKKIAKHVAPRSSRRDCSLRTADGSDEMENA